MIRPWYRSRLFWLGLPGMAFLLWAWWDSGKNFSGVAWMKPTSLVSICQSDGRLCLVVTERAPVSVFSGPWVQFQRERGTHSIGGAAESLFGGGGELARRERQSRRYLAPGLYRLRWSFAYAQGPIVTSSSWLPYREWGVEWWLVVSIYGLFYFGVLVVWQRRKARLMKLHAVPLPHP